jgi:putative flippase GtrA
MKLDRQVGAFAFVGGLGFIIDAVVLYGAMALGTGFYSGRLLSFVAAASVTWILNRSITFTHLASRGHTFSEWLKYMIAMCVGGAVNYGTAAWTYHEIQLVMQFPVLAVAAGSIAGLSINYILAKLVIVKSG